MTLTRKPITEYGKEMILAKLNLLRTVELPKIIDAISEAKKQGDLSENFEYHAAKRAKGDVERKIFDLDEYVKSTVASKIPDNPTKVCFGCKVKLHVMPSDTHCDYIIVGEREADVDSGSISITSPIFRLMIAKSVDSTFTLNSKNYTIVEISHASKEDILKAIKID